MPSSILQKTIVHFIISQFTLYRQVFQFFEKLSHTKMGPPQRIAHFSVTTTKQTLFSFYFLIYLDFISRRILSAIREMYSLFVGRLLPCNTE